MANFRCERLFVMLDEPVPGLDHLRAVDPVEFAWLHSENDAEGLGVTPLSDFAYPPFERPRWRPAAQGLASVRPLIALYEKRMSQNAAAGLEKRLTVLRQVEAVLDAADSRDRRFYFAMKDLA